MPLHPKNLVWLFLSAFILLLDQSSKYCVVHSLAFGEFVSVLPFFNVTLSYNSGAAFSLLANAGGWQLIFFSVISIAVVVLFSYWLLKLKPYSVLQSSALSLIIGGAIGNLWDRVHLGVVVDFLDFYYKHWHFATFNVADSAICIGAALLILHGIFSKP